MTDMEREALYLVADTLDTLARERHLAEGHVKPYLGCSHPVCSQALRAARIMATISATTGEET